MRTHWIPSLTALLLAALAVAATAQEPQSAPFTRQVRERVEMSGVTLASFDCPVRGALEPGDVVDCSGETAEGETHRATVLIVENGAAQLRSISRPAPETPPGEIDPHNAACQSIVEAYNAENWEKLTGSGEPDPSAVARLMELRAATGPVEPAPPHTLTVMGPTVQLEYTLEGAEGPYEFRCGFPLQATGGGVNDWVLAAPRGAAHGGPLLLADMRRQFSSLLERQVERVELPVERLRDVGDWAEARVFFADGGDPLTIGVEVTGRDDDFDGGDFAVAHVALDRVIRMSYGGVESVTCPEPILPDGGEGTCQVRFAGGRERTLWARRNGLEYTIAAPPLASGVDLSNRAAAEGQLREGLARSLRAEVAEVRCDASGPYGPRGELECQARLADGEEAAVVVSVMGDRMSPALVTRDPAHLDAPLRAELEKSCVAWLEAYERRSWSGMLAAMAPDLREASDPATLDRLVEDVGTPVSWTLASHSVRGGMRHELAYDLATDRGTWTFRCALSLVGQGPPPIEGYHLQPEAGSPTAIEALRVTAQQAFSNIVGETVESVELPFDELQVWRAARDGRISLADGRSLAVRVERTGRPDDLDGIDHAFHVMDVPFILRRSFAQRGEELTGVECPEEVVADGGQMTCRVETAAGRTLDVTAQRRGSRYELQPRAVEK